MKKQIEQNQEKDDVLNKYIETEAANLVPFEKFEVTNAQQAKQAVEIIRRCEECKEKIEKFLRPDIQAAYQLHKNLLAKLKMFTQRFESVEEKLRASLNQFISKTNSFVDGVHQRAVWKVEIVDVEKLLRAILAGEYPLEWVKIDTKELEQIARETAGTAQIPGVEFVLQKTLALTKQNEEKKS
jgi:hypothetical protein